MLRRGGLNIIKIMNIVNIVEMKALKKISFACTLLFSLTLSLSLTGCATLGLGGNGDVSLNGEASWYGQKYRGRKTACGEIYNQNNLTAAHRNLPFGTRVKVTNKKNNRSVVVRINDRGPFVPGRIIDLSLAAAQKIDMQRDGVVEVDLEVLR